MSKYNDYAQRLDKSFKSARERFNEGFAKVEKAQKHYSAMCARRDEEYPGQAIHRREVALAELNAAKSEMRHVRSNAFPVFVQEMDKIEKELYAELEKDYAFNPDEMDSNTIYLLEHNLVSPADLNALVEKFSGNMTMGRLLKAYADNKHTELYAGDHEKAMQYMQAVSGVTSEIDNVMAAFKDLKGVARYYSASVRSNDTDDYVAYISKEWDSDMVRKAIEKF